jgi:hypothetical protein
VAGSLHSGPRKDFDQLVSIGAAVLRIPDAACAPRRRAVASREPRGEGE